MYGSGYGTAPTPAFLRRTVNLVKTTPCLAASKGRWFRRAGLRPVAAALVVLLGLMAFGSAAGAPAPGHTGDTARRGAEATTAAAVPRVDPEVALDDYRTDIQSGVKAHAYDPVDVTENDAARTRSMIDGIAGRNPKPLADAGSPVGLGAVGPAALAMWLIGLMTVVFLLIRRRRRR